MLRKGQVSSEAKSLAQRAVTHDPQSFEFRLNPGKILLEAGDKKLARTHLEEALKLRPEDADAKEQLKKLRWLF
jgi:Flp pilus assembly protein TadD